MTSSMTSESSSSEAITVAPPIEHIIAGFQEALDAFAKLYPPNVGTIDDPLWRFAQEGETRIRQLIYSLSQFRNFEIEHDKHLWDANDLDADALAEDKALQAAMADSGAILEFHAEAFYYYAWRLREVLRHFLDFADFDPVGVRNVRNWLIEHSDKAQGVRLSISGLGLGADESGVKGLGLYRNAGEFVTLLLAGLERARDRQKN